MSEWKDYDIVGSYNNQRYSEIDSERTINMFEYIDSSSKKPKTLIQTSGLIDTQTIFPTVNPGGFRAEFVFNGNMFVVIGDGIYKINSSFIATRLQTINTTAGFVGIDANTFQIIFVDGVNGWIYDKDLDTVFQITDSAFPGTPLDTTYLDGFFVVINGETNNFQLSSFNNGLIWGVGAIEFTVVGPPTFNINLTNAGAWASYQLTTPVTFSNSGGSLPTPLVAGTIYYVVAVSSGSNQIQVSSTKGGSPISLTTTGSGTNTVTNGGQLQLGQITSHPGTLTACRTLHRRLFLFSQNYTEVWENAGLGSNLPFRRNNSLLIEYGTPSIGSVEVGFDYMFFLSQDKDGLGSVMQVIGTQAVPVSNRALDFQLAQYSSNNQISDATGILIKENGLIFYRLNFTAANHTYVYNVSMSDPSSEEGRKWHEEQVLNGDRHPAQTHSFFNGTNYYGHYQTHILYSVDPNVTTNAGESIARIRIGKPITSAEYKRLRIDRFHLDLLQGQDTTQTFLYNFTANSSTDIITISTTFSFLTGDPIIVQTSGGVLPSPLAPNTTYYVIVVSSTEVRLALTRNNAISNTYINLLNNGTPINQIVQKLNNNISPEVFLSYSKDGGQSFGPRLLGLMGKSGERSYRTVWRKLGTVPRGQGFVPKIEFFNQVPMVMLGAAWVFEVMPQ